MRNCTALIPLLLSIFLNVKCSPISQPGYENAQYAGQQAIPSTVQYKPQQIHFKPVQASRPVYESRPEGLQYYTSQPKIQAAQSIQTAAQRPVQQVFVQTNQGPRQLDPSLYDQVLKAQQQQPVRKPQPQGGYQTQQIRYPVPPTLPQYSAKYQQQQQQRPQSQYRQPADDNDAEDKDEGDFDDNPSYQFGFDVKDDHYTNYQTRKEERDGKKITGSYSVVDADGYIRTVKYTADPKEGFKAEVSREPTNIVVKIPKPEPQYQSLPKYQQQHQQQQQQQAQPQAGRHPPQYIQVLPHRLQQQQQQQRGEDNESNTVYRYQ